MSDRRLESLSVVKTLAAVLLLATVVPVRGVTGAKKTETRENRGGIP